MSNDELKDQQTDLRGFKELNEAIDNINMKLLKLEKKIERYGSIYMIIIAHLKGKLNKDEVSRISDRLIQAEPDEIEMFLDKVNLTEEAEEDLQSISEMVDALEEDRWSE